MNGQRRRGFVQVSAFVGLLLTCASPVRAEDSSETGAKSNLWQHALLDADAARHQAPSGAALDVGLNEDGAKGVGVFIYRDAPGRGPVAYKGVTLKWLRPPSSLNTEHGTPITDLRVHAIPMVYVPQGPFKTKGPYTAWAGLRPITDLEYEKACRGPREAARAALFTILTIRMRQ